MCSFVIFAVWHFIFMDDKYIIYPFLWLYGQIVCVLRCIIFCFCGTLLFVLPYVRISFQTLITGTGVKTTANHVVQIPFFRKKFLKKENFGCDVVVWHPVFALSFGFYCIFAYWVVCLYVFGKIMA